MQHPTRLLRAALVGSVAVTTVLSLSGVGTAGAGGVRGAGAREQARINYTKHHGATPSAVHSGDDGDLADQLAQFDFERKAARLKRLPITEDGTPMVVTITAEEAMAAAWDHYSRAGDDDTDAWWADGSAWTRANNVVLKAPAPPPRPPESSSVCRLRRVVDCRQRLARRPRTVH